jgi:hypothetical protein
MFTAVNSPVLIHPMILAGLTWYRFANAGGV